MRMPLLGGVVLGTAFSVCVASPTFALGEFAFDFGAGASPSVVPESFSLGKFFLPVFKTPTFPFDFGNGLSTERIENAFKGMLIKKTPATGAVVLKETVLAPEFPYARFLQDGSSNIGVLSVDTEVGTEKVFYSWTTNQLEVQDYTLLFPITVPEGFVSFAEPALFVQYRTESTNKEDTRLEFELRREDGSLLLTEQMLVSAEAYAWKEARFALPLEGIVPGEKLSASVEFFARRSGTPLEAHLGNVTLRAQVAQ